jgi:peptidoglycan/LPS O-acetylase OafA/YrhL
MEISKRIFGLDLMRCVAILLVLIGHLYLVAKIPVSFDKFLKFDLDGVSVFFTLSGFLIGTILIKKFDQKEAGLKTLRSFWVARWWRTLPAYFFVLFLLSAKLLIRHHITISQIFPYLFFFQNFKTFHAPLFGESWSLAVEEWFYLTVPILFLIAGKLGKVKQGVPVIIFIYFLFAAITRYHRIQYIEPKNFLNYTFFIQLSLTARIDAVMFGVVGAYLGYYYFNMWTRFRKALLCLGILGFILNHELVFWNGPVVNEYVLYWSKQVELFFCLCTLPYLSTLKSGKGFIAGVISFIAIISYSIYLFHASFFYEFLMPFIPDNVYARVSLYFINAFGLGYLGYTFIEKWGLRQRQKINAHD